MNFFLPDFYNNFQLNYSFIELLNKHPEYFYDDIKIGALYGSFPGAIWNGGRITNGGTFYDNINMTIQKINELNVAVRFTFTNSLLEEKHLYDTYCNLILECANNGKNEIIVNSPLLEEYLRKEYPNFKYIASTTKCERDVKKINNMCNQYDLVVMDYRDNKKKNFLSKLEHKEKIEILLNAYCPPNCKFRKKHYDLISKAQLNFGLDKPYPGITDCPTQYRTFEEALKFPTVIKKDELYNTYLPNGFSNFKIEGRTINILHVIESYLYYMIKPEYQNKVRLYLLNIIYNQA